MLLEDVLSSHSFMEFLECGVSILEKVGIDLTYENEDDVVYETVFSALDSRLPDEDSETRLKHCAVLVCALKNPTDFMAQFFLEKGVAPALVSAWDAVCFAEEFFTPETITRLFRPEAMKANEEIAAHKRAIEKFHRISDEEHASPESIADCLRALGDVSGRYDVAREIRLLEDRAARESGYRSKGIKRALKWEARMSETIEDYVSLIIAAAERPRKSVEIGNKWPISHGKFAAEVFGGANRLEEKFKGDKNSPETQEAISRVSILLKYAQTVENILNNLCSFMEVESFLDDLPDAGRSSQRLKDICQAISDEAFSSLRMDILRTTKPKGYYDASDRLRLLSNDPVVQARAEELRECGRLLEDGVFLLFGTDKVILSRDSYTYNHRGDGAHYGRGTLGDRTPISFIPPEARLLKNDLNCRGGEKDRVLRSRISSTSITGNLAYLTIDGHERGVSLEKSWGGSQEGAYLRDFRCYERETHWDVCQVETFEWVPMVWRVCDVDKGLGVVKLFAAPSLSIESEPHAGGVNVAKAEHSSWFTSDNVVLFDRDTRAFRSVKEADGYFLYIPVEQFSYAIDKLTKNYNLDFEVIESSRNAYQNKLIQERQLKKEEQERKWAADRQRRMEEKYAEANKLLSEGRAKDVDPSKSRRSPGIHQIYDRAKRAAGILKELGDYKDSLQMMGRIERSWRKDIQVGSVVKFGDHEWILFEIEENPKKRIGRFVSVNEVVQSLFPGTGGDRSDNRVHEWLNEEFLFTFYPFERASLRFAHISKTRNAPKPRSVDTASDDVDHLWLPTLTRYTSMPDVVKERINNGSSGWWLATEAGWFFGDRAYCVSETGQLRKAATNYEKKGIHPIISLTL